MIRVGVLITAVAILTASCSSIPHKVNLFMKEKYDDPVVSEVSAQRDFPLKGIKVYSVYERRNQTEDPLIPTVWLYAGGEIVDGSRIFDVLNRIQYQPSDDLHALRCARLAVSLSGRYYSDRKSSVQVSNGVYTVTMEGDCSLTYPFFRREDAHPCTLTVTLGKGVCAITER